MDRATSTADIEQVIASLLKQDAAARESLRAYQQRRQRMADQMADYKEAMQKKAAEEVSERVEALRAEHQREFDGQMEKMRAAYDAAVDKLERAYQSQHEAWVQELVGRCLGA